jgi:hypothetical protein
MKISASLTGKARAWSESLAREPDDELRGAGYLQLAGRLVEQESFPAAAEVYRRLVDEAEVSAGLKWQAMAGLAALQGKGDFGDRFEHWSRSFLQHASDPASLAAMTAGGLAYRTVRLGVAGKLLQASATPWTRGVLAKGVAIGAGFGAETLAFAALSRGLGPSRNTAWSTDLAHAAMTLVALKLSGAAGNAISSKLFGAGLNHRWSGSLVRQGSMLGGILLGAEMEKAAGWRDQSLDAWEAMATLLHFNIGGELSRRWLGRRFGHFESRLEQHWREIPWQGSLAWGARPALAGAGTSRPAPLPVGLEETSAPRFLSERHGDESGLTPPIVNVLEQRYLRLFPKDESGFYSRDIVRKTCRIRCNLPGFHENLLDALLRSPQVGQLSQLYTVYAIERIFNTDALGTSRGSFNYAPLQMLLGHVLNETDAGLRQHAMRAILATFERGFSRGDSVELLLNFTRVPHTPAEDNISYDKRFFALHGEEANRAWENYRPQDLIPLFNFVYRDSALHPNKAGQIIDALGRGRAEGSPYFASEIDAVLDYSRFHPHGDLILRRLYHIFESGDLPTKLAEIAGEASKITTERYVRTLSMNGHPARDIAETLNGSVHTAYFNDMRLAEKVASVFQEIGPFLANPQLRAANRDRLVDAMMNHVALHRPFKTADYFNLLRHGTYPLAEFFEQAWLAGEFRVEVLPAEVFKKELIASGLQVADCEWSLFRRGRGSPDRILLRDLPPLGIRSPADRDQSFSEVIWRLRGLVHELEHWRHFSGRSPEGPVRPFQLVGINREERLITEVMAYLEEFRWQAMNHDDHYLQIARRLGDSVPLYLRNVAEQSYF